MDTDSGTAAAFPRAMSLQPFPLPLPLKGEDNGGTCMICGLSLRRNTDLPRHMLIHANNKESLMFRCPMEGCNHQTLQKSNLATHIRTHTRAKPHKCPEYLGNGQKCDFSTADPSSLHRHRKRKHGYGPVRPRFVLPRPYPPIVYVPRFADDEAAGEIDADGELVSECESEEPFGPRGETSRVPESGPPAADGTAGARAGVDAVADADVDVDAEGEDDDVDGEGEPENETEPVLLAAPPLYNLSSARTELPPDFDSLIPMPTLEPPPLSPVIAPIISDTRTPVDAQ
ncbi:hypothetical protein B0H16DRAFT_1524043 [Mycena metata]|uniref:C2H2-type domain-containing protein n=1 Tax=Mycena metata TaxID=1033252 RepID=A0AAD7NLW3_9AGAR|nr:hypothetical protein B0H16DRAFT_1524043 [Mycena metata]